MRRSSWIGIVLLLLVVAAGCGSKITGETSNPPPAGGPKASDRHPPGLTDDEAEKAKLK